MVHADLGRLARVVAILRAGETISVPFASGRRGHEVSEEVRLGPWFDRPSELLMRSTTRRLFDGRETTSRWEPVPWSVGDLVAMSAWWGERAVPDETSHPVPAGAAAFLAELDAGGTPRLGGYRFRLVAHRPTGDEPWSATVERVDGPTGCPDRESALDLVTA